MATSPRPSEEKGAEIWTRLHLSMGLFIHFSGLLFLSAVCGLPAAWGEQENGGSVILSADVKPVTRVEGRRKEHSSCRHSFNQVTNPNGRVVLSLFRGTALSPATTTTTATNKTTTDRNINRPPNNYPAPFLFDNGFGEGAFNLKHSFTSILLRCAT